MITETLPHHRENSLAENWKAIVNFRNKRTKRAVGYKRFESYQAVLRAFGITKIIMNYDITYTFKNGWHLHSHSIPIADKDIDWYELDKRLKANWLNEIKFYRRTDPKRFRTSDDQDILHRGVTVTRPKNPGDYISKMGFEKYMTDIYSIAEELVGANAKKYGYENPWQLPPELFYEYYKATKGKKLTNPVPRTFGKEIYEDIDDILEKGVEGAETVMTFDFEAWKRQAAYVPELMKKLKSEYSMRHKENSHS
jgi:hypothetical protein